MAPAQSLAEIRDAVQAHPYVFSERDILKFVEVPLQQLKAAPAEERLGFVFEALALIPDADSLQLQLALKATISSLLRAGLTLSSLEAARLVELVSRPRVPSFPRWKGFPGCPRCWKPSRVCQAISTHSTGPRNARPSRTHRYLLHGKKEEP